MQLLHLLYMHPHVKMIKLYYKFSYTNDLMQCNLKNLKAIRCPPVGQVALTV